MLPSLFQSCRHQTDLNSLWDSLSPLFEIDPLLQRSFLWFQQTPSGLLEFIHHYPAFLLCCSLHLVALRYSVLPDEEQQVGHGLQEIVLAPKSRVPKLGPPGYLDTPRSPEIKYDQLTWISAIIFVSKVVTFYIFLLTEYDIQCGCSYYFCLNWKCQ